jgi:hypothetical protein
LRPLTIALGLLAVVGDAFAQCPVPATIATLDTALWESSGLAPSRRRPGVFWTLLDSDGDSAVFAVDTSGAVRQRVRVAGATNRDWEDIASGPCPGGHGSCLWIADSGDNLEVHPEARIYVIPEPALGDSVSAPARLIRATFPAGPRDAEAIFVTPDGRGFLVSKGRGRHSIQLFAIPPDGGRLTLLQTLAPAAQLLDGVTGGGASPDGRWVALRTYAAFTVYAVRGAGSRLRLREVAGTRTPFRQQQGEAVAFGADGLYFTSEASPGGRAPLARVRCATPRFAWPAPCEACGRP